MKQIFTIEMLPAREGDCILLSYCDGSRCRHVLIDGGRKSTYRDLRQRLLVSRQDPPDLDLLIVSHIDRDHIEGVLDFIKDPARPAIRQVWYNGYTHLVGACGFRGARQGEELSKSLIEQAIPWNADFNGKAIAVKPDGPLPSVKLAGGLSLTVLSPSEPKLRKLAPLWVKECEKAGLVAGTESERSSSARPAPVASDIDVDVLAARPFYPDDREPNGSSIAVLADFRGRRVLLAADAHEDILLQSVRKLRMGGPPLAVDLFKVSHHGSARNLSKELLTELDCRNFAISSDGSHHGLPDAEAIARIVRWTPGPCNLFFNYRSAYTEPWSSAALRNRHGHSVTFGTEGALTIPIDRR